MSEDDRKYDDEPATTAEVIPADGQAYHTDAHRGLRQRHVALIAISGAIGSSVFLSIGNPLTGGPLALLLGVSLWSSVIWAISNFLIEICVLLPLDGGFINYATRFLDPAMGFSLGWNYYICQASLICGEFTAFNVILSYWHPDINPAYPITAGIILLTLVNSWSVRWYGEVEFWISITKIFMIVGLWLYTIVTMCGGNPLHDKYGFRFWKHPGPFKGTTSLDRITDIWYALQWGAYGITGPDYISLISGEVKSPRRILPRAFRSTIYRVLAFYVGSALSVGMLVPYNDPDLLGAKKGPARSPYIISMARLHIHAVPSIISVVVLVSLFSTSSSMVFAASRTLYGLGMQGHAPKFVTRTNQMGLPWVCVAITMCISCLSYLACGSGSVKVLNWMINLTAATQLITWACIAATYLRFRKGLEAQNLTEGFLPVTGFFPRVSAWYALPMSLLALVFSGYFFMAPGAFDVTDFMFTYGAVFIFIVLFVGWKIKGVRHHDQLLGIPPGEMDFVSNVEEIQELTDRSNAKRQAKIAGGQMTRLQKVVDHIF